MITLYDLEACPFCQMVRDKLESLGLPYTKVPVPPARGDRAEVFLVSKQYLVPVLVDGEVTLNDEERILVYLEERYGAKGAKQTHGGMAETTER